MPTGPADMHANSASVELVHLLTVEEVEQGGRLSPYPELVGVAGQFVEVPPDGSPIGADGGDGRLRLFHRLGGVRGVALGMAPVAEPSLAGVVVGLPHAGRSSVSN
jgi:hypothetical protein